MEKRQKSALESGVLILIAAGILIAINALSGLGLYVRADVTKTERFTLSKGSGNLLRSMKQQVFVDAYVTRGLPKLDAFVRDLRDDGSKSSPIARRKSRDNRGMIALQQTASQPDLPR